MVREQTEASTEYRSEAFAAWAATQLLTQLRNGGIPAHARLLDFVWEPFLSQFRAQVDRSDKAIVIRLLRDPATKMWGAFLSRGIPKDDDITEDLAKVFASTNDGDERLGLFHHLAARELDSATTRGLFDWMKDNLELVISDQRRFFAPPETALEKVRKRIQDPLFRHKRWLYLLSAHAAQEPGEVRRFVEPYLEDSDPLVAEAAALSLSILK